MGKMWGLPIGEIHGSSVRLDLHPGLSRAEKGGGCIVLDKLTRVQRAFRRRQRRAERGARDLKRRAVLLGEDNF